MSYQCSLCGIALLLTTSLLCISFLHYFVQADRKGRIKSIDSVKSVESGDSIEAGDSRESKDSAEGRDSAEDIDSEESVEDCTEDV